MTLSEKDTKTSFLAAGITIVFHAIILLLCLYFGLSVTLPLPEQPGVEVNLGNSEDGFGTSTAAPMGEEGLLAQTHSPSMPSYDNVITQNNEDAPAVPASKKDNSTRPTQRNPNQESTSNQTEEPKVNPNALFPGGKAGSQNGGGTGTGQGITSGSGDQGKAGGDPNSDNYDGSPGKGGSGGVSWSLSGRKSKSLPKPQYTSKEEGSVVVRIWVNRDGVVTKVQAGERGTTVADRSLWKMAENAARQSRFNVDEAAAETQTGTITYKFIKMN